MFHAAGWTFPWANVFAFATQVRVPRYTTYPNLVKKPFITDHAENSQLYPHLEPSSQFRRNTLLWRANCPSTSEDSSFTVYIRTDIRLDVQIGIINDPLAKPPPRPVTTIVAGAAPTAHLIEELEKKGIKPVHVYGLTYVPATHPIEQLS
jgi:hypothetical protein